jgi:hypothetical protein
MRLLTICGMCLLSLCVTAQTEEIKPAFVSTGFLPGQFSLIEVDHLGNIYGITPDGHLKKYNGAGDSVAGWYNVRTRGIPTALDVSNPMRILLYYQNYATIVVLDRLLIQRNLIDLRQQQIFSVQAIANAYDNNIWLFDQQDFKLKKINEQGVVLFESADWRMLFPQTPIPISIMDMHNLVYLYDPKQGICSFDYYGSFKSLMPHAGLTFTGMNNSLLYGVSQNTLMEIRTDNGNISTVALLPIKEKISGVRYMNDMIYLLTGSGIMIQKQTKP